MTDFVLEQLNEQNSRTKPMREVFNSLEKYAKFLKQPLKLEMFVPCDEDGNILKEPKRWEDYLQYPDSFDGNKEWGELYDYKQAKEKVLFDGFKVIKQDNITITIEYDRFQLDYNKVLNVFANHRTIEDLAKYNLIELTKNAEKQIGL